MRAALDCSQARIGAELAGVTDAELETPCTFWEHEAFSVRFRMHRFEAHRRQHGVQLEKTLAETRPGPTEAERLVRLLHVALADVENEAAATPLAYRLRAGTESALIALTAEVGAPG